jgi:hypothetical protein
MQEFSAEDLTLQDYEDETTGDDNPKITGEVDRSKVNKTERYEVVDFCNSFLKQGFKDVEVTRENFQKVEKIIRLPEASNIVSRSELSIFVVENWDKQ